MLRLRIEKVYNQFQTSSLLPSEFYKQSLNQAYKVEDLNAFIRLTQDLGTSQAIKADYDFKNGKLQSYLQGIPIAVKDNFCIANIHTTCGSKMLENFVPRYSATIVKKLFEAGTSLIGKTNLDEFAMGSGTVDSIFGCTKNIWQSKHRRKPTAHQNEEEESIAGGSSGGSAVAVAAGVCLGAIGSDTGGSTRNPASYCGVVGLKPTYGLVSRYGLIPLVNSMDVPGILTRSVDDCVHILNVIAGPDHLDSTTVQQPFSSLVLPTEPVVKGLKVGIPKEYYCEGLSDEVKNVWSEIADLLENNGAELSVVSMPHTKYSIVCYSVLNQCEVASNMAKFDGLEFGYRANTNVSTEQLYAESRATGLNQVVRSRILAGNYFCLSKNYDKYVKKAMQIRRLLSNDFKDVWKSGIEILLTPTTLTDAPTYSDFVSKHNREQCATQDFCTQPANMAGCPAVTLPIKLSKKGLPLSIQLMSPNFMEYKMLSCAKFIEQMTSFYEERSIHFDL